MQFPSELPSKITEIFTNQPDLSLAIQEITQAHLLTQYFQALLNDSSFRGEHAEKQFTEVYRQFSKLDMSSLDTRQLIAASKIHINRHGTLPFANKVVDVELSFSEVNQTLFVNDLLVSAASVVVFREMHDARFNNGIVKKKLTVHADAPAAFTKLIQGLHFGYISFTSKNDEETYLELREEAIPNEMEDSLKALTLDTFKSLLAPNRLFRYYLLANATDNEKLLHACYQYLEELPVAKLLDLSAKIQKEAYRIDVYNDLKNKLLLAAVNKLNTAHNRQELLGNILHSDLLSFVFQVHVNSNFQESYCELKALLRQVVVDRMCAASTSAANRWDFFAKTLTQPGKIPQELDSELFFWANSFELVSRFYDKIAIRNDDTSFILWLTGQLNSDQLIEIHIDSKDLEHVQFLSNLAKLQKISIQNSPNLLKLNCNLFYHNDLTEISFKDCKNLRDVEYLYSVPRLRKLDLRGTAITSTEPYTKLLENGCVIIVSPEAPTVLKKKKKRWRIL